MKEVGLLTVAMIQLITQLTSKGARRGIRYTH